MPMKVGGVGFVCRVFTANAIPRVAARRQQYRMAIARQPIAAYGCVIVLYATSPVNAT